MRRPLSLVFFALVALWLNGACGSPADPSPADASLTPFDAQGWAPDAGPLPDTGAPPDAAEPKPVDGGVDPVAPDASEPSPADAGLPLPGFGAVSGECGVLDTELTDPGPAYFENHIDFGADPYDDADLTRLTAGGQEIIADGNAGGSSVLSEVFAYELLHRCELAALFKSEMEIVYKDPAGKLTDLLVKIDGLNIGVSVTRAVSWPRDAVYTVTQAQGLMTKKLQGILDSTANVSEGDKWGKQVLYVLAQSQAHADTIETALQGLSATLKADTIVIVAITDGDDEFIYSGG